MNKSTNDTKTPMGKREMLAWTLIIVFVSVSVGLVAGWFLRSNTIAERDQAVAAVVSKTER